MHVPHYLHHPINFVAQPTNHSPLGFEAQTKKYLRWFWGPNQQTVAIGFVAQTRKPVATGFEAKPGETANLGFEAKPRNPCSSSPYARCRSHTTSSDLSIVWPPNTWHVLYHPWSSTLGLLLLSWFSSLSTILIPELTKEDFNIKYTRILRASICGLQSFLFRAMREMSLNILHPYTFLYIL
jgi:hypothetical protein